MAASADAGAVREQAEAAARYGADAVALSLMHSLFPYDPARYGPYSPSSRLFLNLLYARSLGHLSTTTTIGSDDALKSARRRSIGLAAGAAKFARLRALFAEFDQVDTPPSCARAQELCFIVMRAAKALRQHARFEAEQAAGSERYHLFLQWITARFLCRRAAGGQGGRACASAL